MLVVNVVPIIFLLIQVKDSVGVFQDWFETLPTYHRTQALMHAARFLSHGSEQHRRSMVGPDIVSAPRIYGRFHEQSIR
ncbi:hypothetical protein VNO77_03344 [Canavalia gladiata]|uniref:Uncharacterized protein n=1 Tax=Canavalia gladiata TaxID=3824 RepID=A0AAN9R822_CANGL